MSTRFVLRHERTLPVPLDEAYAWLTDYEDADARRAGAVIESREVLDVDDETGRTVLAERVRSLGLEREVRTVVELDPPDAWRATVHGADVETPDVFTYELEPLDGDACRLAVTYDYGLGGWVEKAVLWLMTPLIRREIARMWDGFEASLRREVAGTPTLP